MNLRAHSVVLLSLVSVGAFAAALGAGCGDGDPVDGDVDAATSSSSSGGSSGASSSSGGSSSGGSSSGGDLDASTLIQAGTLELRVLGGLPQPASDASTCQPADLSYVYERTTRALSWRFCEPVPGTDAAAAVYAYVTGTRTLTAAEDQPIQAALANVARATAAPDSCPTDTPATSLRVFADDTTLQTFYDSCEFSTTGDKEYVTGLSTVRSALAQYTTTPN